MINTQWLKKWMAIGLAAAISLSAAGCGKKDDDMTEEPEESSTPWEYDVSLSSDGRDVSLSSNPNAEQTEERLLTEDEVYYNGHLNLKCTLPKDYWLFYRSDANLSADPSGTKDTEKFDVEQESNDIVTMNLFEIGNMESSFDPDSIGIALYADYYMPRSVSLDEYLSIISDGIFDDDTTLLNAAYTTIGGKDFYNYKLKISSDEEKAAFVIDLFILQSGEYFVVTFFKYYEDNALIDGVIDTVMSKCVEIG